MWTAPMPAGDPIAAASEQLLVLVDQLCAARPTVLVVDDLHWADEASLALWLKLSRATVQLPLLLVAISRPALQREALEVLRREVRVGGGVVLSLPGLAEDSVRALAERQVGGSPGPRLAGRLSAASGNPLYLREMLDAWSRSKALRAADGVVELMDIDSAGRSTGGTDGDASVLSRAIADRLGSLASGTREILRVAALLGPEFELTHLAQVLGQPVPDFQAAVEEALAAGVLDRSEPHMRFRHGLIKQAVYEGIPAALRAALSRVAAEALIAADGPVEQTASSILLALEGADGWELDWLAGHATALAYRAPEIAADLFEHALAYVSEGDPRKPVLQDHLMMVAFLLTRHELVEQLARAVLAGTRDPQRIGQASWLAGFTMLRTGRTEEAMPWIACVIEDPEADPHWRARLTALSAVMHLQKGQLAECEEAAGRALQQGQELSDAMATAWARHCKANINVTRLNKEEALHQLEEGIRAAGTDPQVADARALMLGNQVFVLGRLDRFAEAAESLRAARTLAEGARTGLAQIQLQASENAFVQGRWDDALTDLETITEFPTQTLPVRQEALIARISLHRGEIEKADRYLGLLRDRPVLSGGSLPATGDLLMAQALAAEQAGDAGLACRTFSVILTPEYRAVMYDLCHVLPTLIRFALAAGDLPTARAAAQAAQAEAEQEPLPLNVAAARWCHALLDHDGEAILLSAEYFRNAGRPLELGNALEEAAALLAEAQRDEPARTAFAEAMSVYTGLGAALDARRAANRLRPYGIGRGVRGPRQRPSTGWQALTEMELRVAELVVEGHSNPDIARRLLLSRRTVETHVSHILAKLGTNSRRGVASLLPTLTQ